MAENSTKVVTGKVRFCYANVFEPVAMNEGEQPKYSICVLIPKSDTKTLDAINKAVEAAKIAGKAKIADKNGKIPSTIKIPLRDGDEERSDDPAFEGMMFINATSKDQPEIVDRKKAPITDPLKVGSGDYCMVTLNFAPYNAENTNKGIGAYLSNVQLAVRGERLSGKSSADADFDELPGDDDDALSGELPDFI
jgi:hypothetical protein